MQPHVAPLAGPGDARTRVLTGWVTSGFGVAHEHMAPIAHLLCERGGLAALAPGTLNLRLAEPFRFPPDAEITDAEYGYERLLLKRCCVRGLPAVILRPESHERGNGHGDAYLELLSPVHLRTAFGLIDGDRLDVTLDPALPCWPARGGRPVASGAAS